MKWTQERSFWKPTYFDICGLLKSVPGVTGLTPSPHWLYKSHTKAHPYQPRHNVAWHKISGTLTGTIRELSVIMTQMPEKKQEKGRKVYFSLWLFKRFKSMVSWLHSFRYKARQNVITGRLWWNNNFMDTGKKQKTVSGRVGGLNIHFKSRPSTTHFLKSDPTFPSFHHLPIVCSIMNPSMD
jgi:hypothetical protein